MQRLIFDHSPFLILLCLVAGLGYAWLLYGRPSSWSKNLNRLLFVLRTALVTALLLLLLGPILKQTSNQLEKPILGVVVDDSRSMTLADTVRIRSALKDLREKLNNQEIEVHLLTLSGKEDSLHFTHRQSDLTTAIRETMNRYEGNNLAGIVLISDGIYNQGLSPLYLPYKVPVYTVGVGDTTDHPDVVLRGIDYNRIVYQGNKFPLRAEVAVKGMLNKEIVVSVLRQGKVLQQVRRNSGDRAMHLFDFQIDAYTQGIQRMEVRVDAVTGESNLQNNRATAFVEVVEGKKKVLLVARAPHPDIKAFRTVVEKNPNYEFGVHIPGIQEVDVSWLVPGAVDLVIGYQSPDAEGRTTAVLSSLIKANTSAFIIVGQKTQLRQLSSLGIPIQFEPSGQRDEVLAVVNPAFHDLGFSEDINTRISRYPPVSVPFGRFSFPANARIILQQRIGNVITDRPLLLSLEANEHKLAVLVGEGVWRWRLSEYQETEKTAAFDELFSKLFQYLSTRDDRRKFRCFPIQQEFTSDGPVVLESQVYNDLFEPVYGNTIELEVQSDQGTTTQYRYVTGPGNSRYRIGGLSEGVYRFRATTELKGKRETVRGEFLLSEQNQELQNLTADFGLMRKLATAAGGKFYTLQTLQDLPAQLASTPAPAQLHTDESFQPLINLKWVFFVLLLLVGTEWFIRKYAGSY
jgi:hypothetical protein